ncbi:hypothetical protein [Amnibacterium endophyticum]|uniref:Secreted protein n=1 Tax=Amnibacterium endophyticum TaxID=2109337 RepID=A0ABW4LHY2_9MICO
MSGGLAAVAVLCAITVTVTMWVLVLLARRVRRRGTAGQAVAAAMAAYDEAMHLTAHVAYVEALRQDAQGSSVHSPADH